LEDRENIEAVLNSLKEALSRQELRVKVECETRIKEVAGHTVFVPCIITIESRVFNIKVGIAFAKSKDDLVKLYASKRTLGLDKLIVVVNFNVDEISRSALKLEGIEILTIDEVLSILGLIKYEVKRVGVHYVKPQVDEVTFRKIVDKYQGRIIKRGEYGGHNLIYIPIYDLYVTVYKINYTDLPLESLNAILSFEGITGSLVDVNSKGTIYIKGEWIRLGDLTLDELEVMKFVAKEGMASFSEIQAHFEWENVGAIIDVLIEKGLLMEIGDHYQVKPPNLKGYRGVSSSLKHLMLSGKPESASLMEPEVSPGLLAKIVGLIGDIKEIKIVYYPVYVIMYEKNVGGTKVRSYVLISGVSGERMDDLEELIEAGRLSSLLNLFKA